MIRVFLFVSVVVSTLGLRLLMWIVSTLGWWLLIGFDS